MSDVPKQSTSSTSSENPMKETKPPVMPTKEQRDGGDKSIKR